MNFPRLLPGQPLQAVTANATRNLPSIRSQRGIAGRAQKAFIDLTGCPFLKWHSEFLLRCYPHYALKETPMRAVMEEVIKRWTARRKWALVQQVFQGKTTVTEASRQFDLTPPEIESWVEDGKHGMEDALRAKPKDALG